MLPILVGLGARWSVRSELRELTRDDHGARIENDSYREATGQLASQISRLQAAVDAIGSQAAVDPAASRAMDKLPAIVKSRAMGGGRQASAPRSSVPDTAFGVLRDLLGAIEDRLASCAPASSAARRSRWRRRRSGR